MSDRPEARADAGKKTGKLSSLTPQHRVWALTSATAALALAAYAVFVLHLPALASPLHLPWWLISGLFALAEIFVIHIHFQRETQSFSLSEVPLVLGLFFLSPGQLVLAHLAGAAVALAGHRKQPLLKLVFNLARSFLETCLAVILFHVVVSLGDPLGPLGWVAALGATFLVDLVAAGLVFLAISFSEGRPSKLPQVFGMGTLATFINASLGLISVTVIWLNVSAVWMVVVLAAALFIAYRTYANVREKHQVIQRLYESTRMAQKSLRVDSVILSLLAQAREMCRADIAEVVLFPSGKEERPLRTTLGPEEHVVAMEPVDLDPTEGVWARVASEDQAMLIGRPIANERLRAHFDSRNMKDAMVAPLRAEGEVMGIMLVANKRGDVSTFDSDDLKIFETLTNHASVSIENGRLLDTLRRQAAENEYQAMHDSLTGLPNRALFHDRVRQAILAAERSASEVTVMIMDLDRFKEVNDTLGHHNGDSLLKEIGNRLKATLRDSDTVARLGGDEFAVLLSSVPSRHTAIQMAEKLLGSLRRPFVLQDMGLDVGASIGIAMYPDHGQDADTLIQHADVAMYLAKEGHRGYEMYEQERNHYSPGRLALVAELRAAVENHELAIAYQPKVDLTTNEVVGVEALSRWQHPRHGAMPPNQFIPIAEHTGLIKPLTLYTLESALRQRAAWDRAGAPLTIAVNLSARNLLDLDLPEDVTRILEQLGVPPSALILEITESSIMADPIRTESVLARLSDAGIGISIDDFGTGFSSLSHLKRLPVDEIKVDKSFVLGMVTDDNDAVIVRSIIELGRNLSLRVVAEGVETSETMNRLRVLGCDSVQGFYLSRPISGEKVLSWVADYRRRTEAASAFENIERLQLPLG